MLTYYYYICVALSFINLILFIFSFEGKKIYCLMLLISVLMLVSNLGYLAKAISKTLPEAVIALKICYIGGCFIPPVLLWTICSIANVEVNHWVKTASYVYSFIVFSLVLTIGYNNVYYSHLDMTKFLGTTIIIKKYTKLAILFYLVMIGNMLPTIGIIIYSLIKKNSISLKNTQLIVFMQALNILMFIISRSFNHMIEIMAFMYVVDSYLLLFLQKRLMLYNMEDSINSAKGTMESNAYILFDKNNNYVGSNKIFESIFPNIKECRIDNPLSNIAEANLMISWLEDFERYERNNFTFEKNNKHYSCSFYKLSHKKKNIAYLLEFNEDTGKWNYDRLREKYSSELEYKVKSKTQQLLATQSKLVLGMANMVENRDDNTGGHIKRTSEIIKILIDTIIQNNLFIKNEEFFQNIIKAAPMHDLGKIAISDNILRKPGKLTSEEFEIMKTHAIKSAELVENILEDAEEDSFVKTAINIAKYHHERWDGSGYPEKLRGAEIPFEARIMAVADVYDALVSKRCYKEAMSFEDAAKIMIESMGSHFDPKLEEVFLLSQKRLENYYYYEP